MNKHDIIVKRLPVYVPVVINQLKTLNTSVP